MSDGRFRKALEEIDRVAAVRLDYGGPVAVTQQAVSYKACIERLTPPGSSYRMKSDEISAFPKRGEDARTNQQCVALLNAFRTDVAAGRVELAEEWAESKIMSVTKTRIFISHAAADAELAAALITLVEAGVETPTGTIRCTSVPGYNLEGGDDGPEVSRSRDGRGADGTNCWHGRRTFVGQGMAACEDARDTYFQLCGDLRGPVGSSIANSIAAGSADGRRRNELDCRSA